MHAMKHQQKENIRGTTAVLFVGTEQQVRISKGHYGVSSGVDQHRRRLIVADAFMKEAGIIIEPRAPYRHQQNGKAERVNRTLIDMGRTMLVDAGLPEAFRAEAIRSAVYLKNRLPSKSCPQGTLSAYEAFYGDKPVLQEMHPFGCAAYVEIPRELRRKNPISTQSKISYFLGVC
jgi:hypothetical protein